MTKRDDRYNTGTGASYAVLADSNGDVGPGSVSGLTFSNNGSATAAFAGWSLILKPAGAPPPSGSALKVWDGSAWVTKPVKVWDGSSWITGVAKVWDGSAWS